jgi:hypothetical protein
MAKELDLSEFGAAPGATPELDLSEFEATPAKERTWGEALKDTGVEILGSTLGVAKLGAKLGDKLFVGQGEANPAIKFLNEYGEAVDEQKSDVLRAKQRAQSKKIAGAENAARAEHGDGLAGDIAGFAAGVKEGVTTTISDPTLLMSMAAQQIPMMGTMGAGSLLATKLASGAAKIAPKMASTKAGQYLAKEAAVGGSMGAGMALQGSDVGSQTYKQMMALPDDVWQQNKEFSALSERIGPEAAKHEIADRESTKAGGYGALASLATMALIPGGKSIEKAMAGGKAIPLKAIPGAVAGETFQEGSEEGLGQLAGNAAVATVDPSQRLMQGVGGAVGQGGVMGGLMAGGINGFRAATGRPDEITPVVDPVDAKLDEQIAKGNSPLSRAAAATRVDDAFTQRATEVEAVVRADGLLDKLRTIGPQHVDAFLNAFQVARNQSAPAAARQEAINTLNLGMEWIAAGKTPDTAGNGSPYSTGVAPYQGQPEQDTQDMPMPAPGLPLDDAINADATDVSNRLGAPPAPLLTNDPSPSLQGLFSDGETDGATGPTAPGVPPGTGGGATDTQAGLGSEPGRDAGSAADAPRANPDDVGHAGGDPVRAADAPVAGDPINKTWTAFHPASGTLNIPRASMPQIRSEHRGAMVNFLKARGITSVNETVQPESLKPTQDKFAPAKVRQAMAYEGGNRPVLVSSDGHVLDGHHQWLAAAQTGVPIRVTRLSAPIVDLLKAVKDFPSAGMTKDTESQPTKTPDAQATQTQQATQEGPQAPAAVPVARKVVQAPKGVVAAPASASNPGTAQFRKRRAELLQMAKKGFNQVETVNGVSMLVNPVLNQAMPLGSKLDVHQAQQAIAMERQARDTAYSTTGVSDGQNTGATGATSGGQLGQGQGPNTGTLGEERRPEPLPGASRGGSPARNSGRNLEDIGRDAADVAITAPRLGSTTVTLADPDSEMGQVVNNLLDVFAGLVGERGIAINDSSSKSSDGHYDPATGRWHVNTHNPEMQPSRTAIHEPAHRFENHPDIVSLYHDMWKLVPNSVRKAYFEGYLKRGTSFDAVRSAANSGSDDAKQILAKLKSEFLADFMAGNFNDRTWLEGLAKKKPHLFQQFVKEWIPMLGNMIDLVTDFVKRREIATGKKSTLHFKDIDALMALHGAAKNLVAMKELAMGVAEVWAMNNPGMAQKSGVPDIMQSVKERDIDLDFMDFLNMGPLEINQAVTDAQIQAQGLTAEDAFPRLVWSTQSNGYRQTKVKDLYTKGEMGVIQLEPEDAYWGATMRGTWIGPADMELVGYATETFAKDFVHRFVAAKDLEARKFDILSAVPAEQAALAVQAWQKMSQVDGVRRYGKSQSDLSLNGIAKSLGLARDNHVNVVTEELEDGLPALLVEFENKASGDSQSAMLEVNLLKGKKIAIAHTESLTRGGLGGGVYQMFAEYAAGHDLQIHPDTSLSGVNTYRRTEQMLSAALRTGKSNVMIPHEVQRVYGFNAEASTPQEHDDNLARLLLTTLRNARELVPALDNLHYSPETGVFTDGKGADMDRAVRLLLMDNDARAFGMGRSTLARAVMTKDILAGRNVKADSFMEPVLYSARDTAELEYAGVKEKYQGTAQWMKAPDGSKSKLTERQWLQVRTPAFKSWFGDWEKGNIWGRDDVSKAVGDNGEPLVVYHGTDKGGFMAFKEPGGSGRGDLGIFTTSNYSMARSYVRRGRPQELNTKSNKEKLDEIGIFIEDFEGRLSSRETEDRTLYQYTDPNGREVGPFVTEAEAENDAINDFWEGEEEIVPTVYAAFVNLRTPGKTDFEGALWSGERQDQWTVVFDGELQSNASGKQYFEEDEARALAKEFASPDDEYEGADYMVPAEDHYTTTDGVVREARMDGSDGAIIRQVVDDGGGPGYNLDPSDVFVAFKPNQLKSADFNTGEFGQSDDLRYSPREVAVGDKTDIAQLPVGIPVPAEVGIGSLEQSLDLARSKSYRKGRDLKVDLQDRVLGASKAAGVDISQHTQANFKFLSDMVYQDAVFSLLSNENAIGWYDGTISRAIGAVSTVHPEIMTQPKNRLAFMWALAVTSNGLKVGKNFELANKTYEHWVKTGKMPEKVGIGNAAQAINKGLQLFNALGDKVGYERLSQFMMTEFTVGEIDRMLGIKPGGEWTSIPVRGAAILGPKIGNGFFSNLNGFFDSLTMDRWLMRTFGRMTGTLIGVEPEVVDRSRGVVTKGINSMTDKERRDFGKILGISVRKSMNRKEVDAMAVRIQKVSMKPEARELMNVTAAMSALRKSGNTHAMTLDGQNEAPSGPSERNWIRAIFTGALDKLAANGKGMTMSDLQALLWYPERRLYDAAKSDEDVANGYEDDEAPDYANAAMALALESGVDRAVVLQAMADSHATGTVKGKTLSAPDKEAMLKEFRKPPVQPMQLAFEVAPDPANDRLVAAWEALTAAEKTNITKQVKDLVLDDIAALVGVSIGKTAAGTGGFGGMINPNLISEYKKKSTSLKQARALAAAIGYVLDQDSVALVDGRVPDSNGLVRITFSSNPAPHLAAIFAAIQQAIPGIDAFTSRGNNFDILNFTEQLTTEELHDKVGDVLDAMDSPLEYVLSHGDIHSELIEKDSYEGHTQGLRPGAWEDIRAGLDALRDRARQSTSAGVQSAREKSSANLARAAGRRDRPVPGAVSLSGRDAGDQSEGYRGRDGAPGQRQVWGAGEQRGYGPESRGTPDRALPASKRATAQAARLAPLAGAPAVAGFHGPDPRLVGVAEAYAKANGISLKRQAEYVQINESVAKRLADAYEAMPHAPQDPKVKAAFANLIKQTTAQYQALADAGYKFWFTDLSKPDNAEYLASPWNAMRDIRANQQMGIFPTNEGYGSDSDFKPENNPMLADTGIKWPSGGIDGPLKPVLANDLFRAVHDAFGHGLEGAGFRAQGEENAWQAHARLFTGSALAAITSETRGQNSWLNYGPHGEANQKASIENTVFADQKTGLLPEWAWKEAVAGDMQDSAIGTQIVGAIHYGSMPGLNVLSGAMSGTGIKGAEQARLENTADPRLTKRVYFYPPMAGGIPQAEIGLGGHVYRADLDGIYDLRTAKTPVRGSGDAFESALLDAGYTGYINPEQGAIVVLNQDVPVTSMGRVGDHKVLQRRAERIIPKTVTRTEGVEMVRRPESSEVMSIIKNKAALAAAAPSFRMEYGEARVKLDEAPAADLVLREVGSSFQFTEPLFSLRDADAVVQEQEQQDEAVDVVAPRKWAGLKVVVPVQIEDTGEVASLTMAVNSTIDDYNERTANLNRLLECL